MKSYIDRIYKTRFFWTHLAKAELKYKFRRSKLGILWTFLNPLLLTLLMTIVFGTVFGMSYADYAPYILSGLIVWELISSSVIGGGNTFLIADPYIRQCNHPIIIYPLKSALVNTGTFLIATNALVIWMLFVAPQNILLGVMTIPLTTILYFFFSWGIVSIASFVNTKFRDYPQVMSLVMQGLWYVSPVFFRGEMFKTNAYLEILFNLNPITHILNLVREPFLYGRLPSLMSYLYTVIIILVIWGVAVVKIRKEEKQVIFYL